MRGASGLRGYFSGLSEHEAKPKRSFFRAKLNHCYSVDSYWKLDAEAYGYPAISVPWDPTDAVDPKLAQLR